MAECPGGWTNRGGTRSQFRLGTPGLGLFKGLYPVHLGDIMDVEQSSQTGVLSAKDLISPSKGTRTRTVREYEQTIDALKKENFDLKLRVYMCEESKKKLSCKEKDGCSPDKDTVQVVVQLKLETESLRKDLAYKEKVLQDALERAEKYELDFKELEKKYVILQNELSSLSELPSKQEFSLLLDEKENLLKQTESLEQALIEKNQEIHNANEKIEILANQNTRLEEKIVKRNLAIEGFVFSQSKEQKIPNELRSIVISATQAAKNQNKHDLAIAVKNFSSTVNQIMLSTVQMALNESEEKENIERPQAKCLKEEFLEKSSAFLPSQTESFTELSHIQSFKEVLGDGNLPVSKQLNSLDSTVHDSYMKGKIISKSSVNVPEDFIQYLNFSSVASHSIEKENLMSFSNIHSSQLCSVEESNLINIEDVSTPLISSHLIHQDEDLSKRDVSVLTSSAEESCVVLKENEKLKCEIKEKVAIIQDLRTAYKELELRSIDFQERENDALKASKCYSVYTQTNIAGPNLLDEYDVIKLQKDAELSSNVDELREDVLLLLLAIEDKNKELVDVKQALSAVQEDLNRALNASSSIFDKDYMNERNEIHERLAFSCSVNVQLMKQLRNLEAFMEDLLQNKFDSSMESEKSDFLSNVSRCLNESLKLSNALSDHLSICEESKLFEECESVLYKNAIYSEDKSLPNLNLSELNAPNEHPSSYPGAHHLEDYIPFVRKIDERMDKEFDSSQLCWRCWQQLNSSSLNKPEISHLMQNNVSSKYMPYPSSDSDIWSEPDRNVSMQRIGISLQNSPVASKSPRKLRLKEKRMSNKLSSDLNTSSSEMQCWSKQRRHGSVSRRLFSRESIKNLDFTSEKFYFLLAEKYSKLRTLLETLENVKDSGVSNELWIQMNSIVLSLGEALQKLQIAKENAKNFPSVICGKCVMLELFMNLKASLKEADFCVGDLSENEILQKFQREVQLLEEACKEPFSNFTENIDIRSQSTQRDSASDCEQVKISELEDVIVDLNDKIKNLNKSYEEVKRLLSNEKEMLESVKFENGELSNQINNLKEELLGMKQKEKEISLKNEELVKELSSVHSRNSALNSTLKDLEQKRKESNITLDQLTAELQKKKFDLVSMETKCLEYEKKLNEQLQIKEEYEEKLKNLETASLGEKETLYHNIHDLSSKKNHYQKELESVENRKLALEKENSALNANLESKCNELSSSQELLFKEREILELVKSENQELSCQINNLQEELLGMKQKELSLKNEEFVQALTNANRSKSEFKSTSTDFEEESEESSIVLARLRAELQKEKIDLVDMNAKCLKYEEELNEQKEIKEEYEKKLKNLESSSLSEKETLYNNMCNLSSEKNYYQEELESIKNIKLDLEKKNTALNASLKSKCSELSSLQALLSKEKETLELVKSENQELSNQISNLREKLSLTNESELKSTSKDFEEKRNESSFALDQLTAELHKKQLNLINMNAKCLEYEKELNEQKLIKEEYEEKLKKLESTLLGEKETLYNNMCGLSSEKNYYQKELESVENRKLDLEKENATLSASLKSKCSELSSLQWLFSKEKETLESVKYENQELSNQINNLKGKLFLKNEELLQVLTNVNRNGSELNSLSKDFEEKRDESSIALDQLSAELHKNQLNLINTNARCLEYEKELNEQKKLKEEYEKKLKTLESVSLGEKETLYKNMCDLSSEKNYYQEELKSVENRKLALEKENAALSANLKSKCSKLSSLQETLKMLEEAKETLSSNCRHLQTELKNTKDDLLSLQKKCNVYEEEVLVKFKANEEEYCRQLKQLQTDSLSEKKRLHTEISKLALEREDIFKKLNAEKEHYNRLMLEKDELKHNFAKSSQQISSLKLLNEELKNKQQNLLQRNSFFENALLSSNSECDSLNKDLKNMRETLQNLESKCMVYEKEIVAAAGMKENLVECLLNMNREFSTHRQKLNEMCKAYGCETSVVRDETSVFEFIPVIDEDNVKKLSENLCFECKKLLQSVDMLLNLLKTFHLKSVETKNMKEKHSLKTTSMRKQMEFHKAEGEHLNSQNEHLQQVIDELQKSISEKEKSIKYSAYEIQSLKEKIHNTKGEIEKGNEILKRKDDEITMLQERVFNLQSYVNTIMADKINVHDISPSRDQLPSSSDKINLNSVSKAIQVNEFEDLPQSAEESFISVSTPEADKNSCCEKYLRKYHSLQRKLVLCKKHIEILEKEKNDLREHYLSQLQSKDSSSLEKEETVNSKLVDLESKLEQKKAFISELKAELLKTCNSLIDKEKEIDDIKEKLSQCEKKFKCTSLDMSDHSISSSKTVDDNIRSLRNYKWKLIQTIFDIQRKLYEKRGIHLNYFDRFKDHVNNLYSMQLTHSLSKSESMPLLESQVMKQQSNQGEYKLKNLVWLELDIECLENLKIFLNRFFVPSVVETSHNDQKSPNIEKAEKGFSSDKLSLEAEFDKLSSLKLERMSSLGISFPNCATDHLLSEHKQSPQKNVSFENLASNVSHHLDYIENFFLAVKKFQWLESLDLSAKESMEKAEVKSLLLKILEEIKILQEGANKLFNLNELLKNFDFVVAASTPLSFSRPDVSDRESLMSEETIGISRSESPLSFEELCTVKLSCSEALTLEERTVKPKSLDNKGTVTQPYSVKITTIGSSCDSVCQRSHYSSPDLGIESDPNHESSAPEQKDEGINKYQRLVIGEKKIIQKPQPKTAFTSTESAGRFKGIKFGETLYSIGKLPHYELLKREIQESLVGIKSVLSRTGDGLHHVAKYTSPRKTLEYNTLKAIKDSCANIEVCLKEAYSLVGKFWIAACPSEKEWKALIEENQSMTGELANLRAMIQKQEGEFKKAMGKLEHAQLVKANIEKKISRKLVKTKKVIRQAELKLLENRCQNLPPVPKYPSEQANLVQQKESV